MLTEYKKAEEENEEDHRSCLGLARRLGHAPHYCTQIDAFFFIGPTQLTDSNSQLFSHSTTCKLCSHYILSESYTKLAKLLGPSFFPHVSRAFVVPGPGCLLPLPKPNAGIGSV